MRFPPKNAEPPIISQKLYYSGKENQTPEKLGAFFILYPRQNAATTIFFGLHFILRQKAAAIAIYITVLSCSMPIVKSY